jgi:hypothetical protein
LLSCRDCDFQPHIVGCRAPASAPARPKEEPKRGSARRWNAQSANKRDCDPVKRTLSRNGRGRRQRQTGAPPDPGTRPGPHQVTRSPAEAGPKSGRKRPKRGKSRLPESHDRREVFLAGSGGKLVDRGHKSEARALSARATVCLQRFRVRPAEFFVSFISNIDILKMFSWELNSYKPLFRLRIIFEPNGLPRTERRK